MRSASGAQICKGNNYQKIISTSYSREYRIWWRAHMNQVPP